MKYILIPGRIPTLSLAEVLACGFIVEKVGPEIFVIESDWSARAIQDRLGGIIKVVRYEGTFTAQTVQAGLLHAIKTLHARAGKKFSFGMSVMDGGIPKNQLAGWRSRVHGWGMTIKKQIARNGMPARYVVSKEHTLSSGAVLQGKLLQSGCEIVLGIFPDTMVWGITEAVQDIEAYTERDVGRPSRHMGRGMLPPKVAQVMVNLARVPAGGSLLDPFCGVGTVLQEGARLGYKVFGSDRDAKAVEATQKNLAWILTKTISPNQEVKDMVKQGSVEQLVSCWRNKIFDAIIAEPDLGPVHPHQWNHTAEERLIALYRTSFESFAHVLAPGGRVVFLFPMVGDDQWSVPDSLLIDIENMGFKREPISIGAFAALPWMEYTKRGSLMYGREGQNVKREIVVFKIT